MSQNKKLPLRFEELPEILQRASAGEKLTRKDRRRLQDYFFVYALRELEHICDYIRPPDTEVDPDLDNSNE